MRKLSALLLFVCVVAVTAFTTLPPTPYKIGDTATDFKLKSVDGKMYSMSDYKKTKGFIIIFICNCCSFC